MEERNLQDLVRFSEEAVQRSALFESERLWCEVLCLDRNQSFGPSTDRDSDALFTVVAGEAVFLVERKRRRVKQWSVVLVPAGSEVWVRNASLDPLVLMLTVAPPPVPRYLTE